MIFPVALRIIEKESYCKMKFPKINYRKSVIIFLSISAVYIFGSIGLIYIPEPKFDSTTEETDIAHKTGWSGKNKETGITAAVNNIGIVFLPNGEHFTISVFVTESKEDLKSNEKIISDISKVAWDYFADE